MPSTVGASRTPDQEQSKRASTDACIYRQIPPVWHVSLDWLQSWQITPPAPQAVAVVPLLQLPPVSQHPVHAGHGADASGTGDVDVDELELELPVTVPLLIAVLVELRPVVAPALLELDAWDTLPSVVPALVLTPGLLPTEVAAVLDPA
jgi:hypothetical protein